MKENRRSNKPWDWNRFVAMQLSRLASLNFSFKSLVTVICLTLCLFPIALFHLWYPQGFDDLLINAEWRHVPNQPTQQHLVGEQGRRRMRQSSAMIVGVGKDIEHRLPSFLRQVEALSAAFNESRAVFVEGDSSDHSREKLQAWASKSPTNRTIVTVTSSGDKDTIGVFQGLKLPREGRLAIARNHVLDALRKLPRMDFIIMVDMDVIGWNIHGIQDSFGRPSWDVICANGIIMHGMYRDTYAFRSKDIDTNHHKGGGDHLLYNISAAQKQKNREIVRVSPLTRLFCSDDRLLVGEATSANIDGHWHHK